MSTAKDIKRIIRTKGVRVRLTFRLTPAGTLQFLNVSKREALDLVAINREQERYSFKLSEDKETLFVRAY
tara:strand:+ start:329 stop:538 length:210 start_codon:yes stop_codon:yes gene_type:complete